MDEKSQNSSDSIRLTSNNVISLLKAVDHIIAGDKRGKDGRQRKVAEES